jgi:hypothetical protein
MSHPMIGTLSRPEVPQQHPICQCRHTIWRDILQIPFFSGCPFRIILQRANDSQVQSPSANGSSDCLSEHASRHSSTIRPAMRTGAESRS